MGMEWSIPRDGMKHTRDLNETHLRMELTYLGMQWNTPGDGMENTYGWNGTYLGME